MPDRPGKSHYRNWRLRPIAGGLNDARNPTLLAEGETPDCRDIEFNADSVSSTGGAVKFGNQPAPKAGIQTRAPRSLPPLKIDHDISVPSRGYGYFPYHPDHDLGGDFAQYDDATTFLADTFHARRGRSFEFTVAVEIPKEDRVYGERNGENSGIVTSGASDSKIAELLALGSHWNETAEEFSAIVQKGGDRLAAMSWALGIVNVGSPATWNALTGDAGLESASPYAVVFTWLDAPQWGHTSPGQMRYYVGGGGTHGTTSDERYSTHAHRALVAKAFLEPGRSYQIAVSLGLDTGTITGGDTNTPTAAWNQDGTFSITVSDDLGNVTTYGTLGTDLFVWKGPSDSYDYLTRYGVRFSGRDAMFAGLGMRFAPWNKQGFIPLGFDSAAMEAGGHRMRDVTNGDTQVALGFGSLTSKHNSSNSRMEVSVQGLGVTGGGENPLDPTGGNLWPGLFDGAGVMNPEALRNYWATIQGPGSKTRGLRVRLGSYEEVAGPVYRFTTDLAGSSLFWDGQQFFVQGFRWHQRALRISTFRIFDAPRDYTDARVKFSLRSETLLSDTADATSSGMIACWPMDDAGGATLRETVAARDGFLAPFTLAQPSRGGVFLSGEGERLVLDFSEDPALQQALAALGNTRRGGVAIELELILTEGYYALDNLITYGGANFRSAKHAPVIASWAVRDAEGGVGSVGEPMLELGHRCRLPGAVGGEPFYYPMGFALLAATDWDQRADVSFEEVVHPWNTGTPLTPNWSTTAQWVGQVIRIQVGLHSTGTDDEFKAYIAATPKQVLYPESGDPSDAEMVYWTTQTIRRRDLARSVVTLGGRWAPHGSGDPDGYMGLSCRMVLRQARVFASPASGRISEAPLFLAATAEGQKGSINYDRDGKLIGGRCLPAGELEPDDILRPLGQGAITVSIESKSRAVTSSSGIPFSTEEPEDSPDAVARTLLVVSDDGRERRKFATQPDVLQDFYLIESVAAGGASATLARPLEDESRVNAWGRSFRLVGYGAFGDDISAKPLGVTVGDPYEPGASTAEANALVEGMFANGAPPSAGWDLALMTAVADPGALAPGWWRACNLPRKNPILGLRDFGGSAYAVARGCIYELDDRWRRDGPTDSIRSSLEIRNEILAGVSFPLEGDGVRFDGAANVQIRASLLSGASIVVDAWIWLDSLEGYRTWLWVGNEASDPSQPMGVYEFSWAARCADGHPELAIGSTATHDGTNAPEKGLYVARASAQIRPRTWTHVRWRFWSVDSNTWIATPECYINGRLVRSTVNATESGAASGEWVTVASVPLPTGGPVTLVGVARDSFVDLTPSTAMDLDALDGTLLPPDRLHGRMHALGGRLAGLVIDSEAGSGGGSNFNPHAITYAGTRKMSALEAPEGVGHKVQDAPGARYGIIQSHPFISLHHELGQSERLASFAEYGNRLVVTNGGRPVYVQG